MPKILKLSSEDFLKSSRGPYLFSHISYVEDIEILNGVVQVNQKRKVKQFSIEKIEWLERPKDKETYIRRTVEAVCSTTEENSDSYDIEFIEEKMSEVCDLVGECPRSIGALGNAIREEEMSPWMAQHIAEMAVEFKDLRAGEDSTVYLD